ncbi:MAG: hypothetical protein H0U98_10095 [Alphaproteobacteria bacterium]|nr:hypothetical protein [Alphaproteobacteria bacterium]
MKFWKKKRAQVENAVDEVAVTATELAEKTLTIGAGGVLLMLGAAAVGAAAAYVANQTYQKKKAASKAARSKSDK